MSRSKRRPLAMFVVGFACFAPGCGGSSQSVTPENPMEGVVLNEVAEAYRSYSVFKGGPPSKFADLEKLKNLSPAGVQAMKKGEVVVFWGAKLPDTGEEPGSVAAPEILAYQKQVPEQGGYVLQLDRKVKKMTADEFKAAPKAGKG